MTESLGYPVIHMRGETIDVSALTGEELIEAGRRLQYPYLFIIGQERQVVEGAERMLEELNNPSETEKNSG